MTPERRRLALSFLADRGETAQSVYREEKERLAQQDAVRLRATGRAWSRAQDRDKNKTLRKRAT